MVTLNTKTKILLEVCVASVEDAIAAYSGGADRLELNLGLELGGLTPSIGLLEEVKRAVELPVLAMVRPTPGGFVYTPAELRLMMRDAEMLLAAGADGIVSGALSRDGALNVEFWRSLQQLTSGRELVFHRALDVVPDQSSLLRQLIDLGTTRVLTSGGCNTAWEGREQIGRMQQIFGHQIEILLGAGVSPDNVVSLVRATGCHQVHGSFSRLHSNELSGWLRDQSCRKTCSQLVSAARIALDLPFDA